MEIRGAPDFKKQWTCEQQEKLKVSENYFKDLRIISHEKIRISKFILMNLINLKGSLTEESSRILLYYYHQELSNNCS